MIGSSAPSAYLQKLQNHAQVQLDNGEMNDILQSHCIPPERLRADDFDGFYHQRKQALLKLIAAAMGKQILSEGLEAQDDGEDEEV